MQTELQPSNTPTSPQADFCPTTGGQSGVSSIIPQSWISKSWQGGFWKVFSCACFAGINGVVRYVTNGAEDGSFVALNTNTLMFFQNVFGTLFLLPWILKVGVSELKTHYPGLHFIRVTTAVLGVYLWYLALKTMPIAEGVALNFTGPIFTVIGAWIFLQERLHFFKTIAILLSIVGAFIISCPSIPFVSNTSGVGIYALLPLSSAILLAFNKLLTRKLANYGESPTTLAVYLLLLMIPVSFVPALYDWQTPELYHWPWLILAGALAAAAHLSFSKAYQLAEVTFLMPIGFSKFFLSALVGYLAFAELPTHWTLWLGMGIIFISILLLNKKKI